MSPTRSKTHSIVPIKFMCSRKTDKHSKGSFKNLSACQMCNTRNHFAVQKNEREDFDQQPSSIFILWGFDEFNGFHLHGKSWPASPPSSHDIERNSPS